MIKDQIDELLEYRLKVKNRGINDFERNSFESKFSDNLKTYYNYIEDEIDLPVFDLFHAKLFQVRAKYYLNPQ